MGIYYVPYFLIFKIFTTNFHIHSEAYLEPCQTSKMNLFGKIVDGFLPWSVFVKSSILDVWQGFEYTSIYSKCKKIQNRKTSDNQRFSDVFMGECKEKIGNKWFKHLVFHEIMTMLTIPWLTFSWRRSLSANQWIVLYMVETSVMIELNYCYVDYWYVRFRFKISLKLTVVLTSLLTSG